ncbi:MAG: BPSS1780 family membrane protein [Sideroxydans sp.]|nr:BPSS1780 family membrane protein [Sideroxydans sp.]
MQALQVNADRGWAWIKRGATLFMKAPLLWGALLITLLVAAMALSSIPFVGEAAVSLLTPVIMAGLMVGCRALDQNEELELAHLFSGFKRGTASLVTLGGISLLSQFGIFGVMTLLGGGELVDLMMSQQPISDPSVLIQAASGANAAMLVGMALFCLLMMALQYAPMLVYFRAVPPLPALLISFRAFTSNIGAMSVYGLIFFSLAIFASLPMMLGWLVLLPVMFTSMYSSYAELFPAYKTEDTPVNNSESELN